MKTGAIALLLSSDDSIRLWKAALSSQGVGGYGLAPGKRNGLLALRSLLSQRQADAAIIDTRLFAAGACEAPSEVIQLRRAFPDTRIFLTIPGRVHVAPAERRWTGAWGAEAVLPDTSAAERVQTMRLALDIVFHALGRGPVDATRLSSAVHAVTEPDLAPRHFGDLRRLEHAGIDPMQILAQLRDSHSALVEDRSWRGKSYRECFIASEAVSLARRKLRMEAGDVVAAGRVLQGLGFIHHVVREQAFADEELFFRFGAADAELDRIALGRLLTEMRGPAGVDINDRAYLGKTYPRCFVGRDAIEWLRRQCMLGVGAAADVGQRMLELGLLHHVVDEHPFLDGPYFYRFLSDER